jgi:hypothetical protein
MTGGPAVGPPALRVVVASLGCLLPPGVPVDVAVAGAPTAPAASALATLVPKGQVPRRSRAILPPRRREVRCLAARAGGARRGQVQVHVDHRGSHVPVAGEVHEVIGLAGDIGRRGRRGLLEGGAELLEEGEVEGLHGDVIAGPARSTSGTTASSARCSGRGAGRARRAVRPAGDRRPLRGRCRGAHHCAAAVPRTVIWFSTTRSANTRYSSTSPAVISAGPAGRCR